LLIVILAAEATILRGDPQSKASEDSVTALVRQLGDERFARREEATRKLRALGPDALTALRKAASHEDAEIRRRAAMLTEAIERSIPLSFNGKDLTGWEGLERFWHVRDGDLVGDSAPGLVNFNTCLCSRKKLRDFELWFQVRVTGRGWAGNSGVQIRSELVDREKFIVRGPQCDIGAGYWGDLYGELFGGLMRQAPRRAVDPWITEGAFNDYFIRCVGKRVTIQVNGTIAVDGDFPQLPEQGIIAWQLHGGGPMTVTFRNIELTELGRK
jgi:hypothetical protein